MLSDGPSKSEIDTVIQKSKGLLTPAKAAAILRRYDHNVKEAANVISTRLPVPTRPQDPPLISPGDREGRTNEAPGSSQTSPTKDIGATTATTDDMFDWLETLQLDAESNAQRSTLETARAVRRSNNAKDEQIAALQAKLEDLRARMEKVVVRLEELVSE